jgi:phosphoenolpyruvate carboxylase
MVPAGSAPDARCAAIDERGLAFVRRMNAEWPFFASTLDAVADVPRHGRHGLSRGGTRGSSATREVARRALLQDRARPGAPSLPVMPILDRPTLAPGSTLARSIELHPTLTSIRSSFIQLDLLRRKRALLAEGGARCRTSSIRAPPLTIQRDRGGAQNTG